MLVLSRKTDERIILGNEIVVTVVSIDGDHVKLGVDAPRHIRVDRIEVHERRQKELRLAKALGALDLSTLQGH